MSSYKTPRAPYLEAHDPSTHPLFCFQFPQYYFFNSPSRFAPLLPAGAYHTGITYIDWDVTEVREEWMDGLRPFDALWAPCPFTARVLAKLYAGPIHVVPPFVKPVAEMYQAKRTTPERGGSFNFLYIFSTGNVPRKNPAALICAYRAAFGPDAGTKLILKINNGQKSTHWGQKLIAGLKALAEGRGDIEFIEGFLSTDALAAIYRQAHVYVSPHRCEGLGLTVIEAMQAGLKSTVTQRGVPISS